MMGIYARKFDSLARCLNRVHDEYAAAVDFDSDITRQDAAILNLLRACELSLDISNRLAKDLSLGLADTSRDVMDRLVTAGALTDQCGLAMKNMIGLRNVAVHDYQKLDINVVRAVIENHLVDFERFASEVKGCLSKLP